MKSRPHDSHFLTAPLCSRAGSQSRQNKELANPANLYTILNLYTMLNLYTYTGAMESLTVCCHCCWGRVGLAGDGGSCSGACSFPAAGVTVPAAQPPPALLAGDRKSAGLSPLLSVLALLLLPPFPRLWQEWTVLLSCWKQIPFHMLLWGTSINLFLYLLVGILHSFFDCFLFFQWYLELRASAWTGFLCSFHHSVSISLP